WTRACQWSTGEVREPKRGEYKSGYDILKLTLHPEPGFARKEILFTRKDDAVYAICPALPEAKLTIRDLKLRRNAVITLLGHEGALTWRATGNDILITLPRLDPGNLPCQHAWTFKIKGVQ